MLIGMMLRPDRTRPRAYVAFPVDPEKGLLTARDWALDHADGRITHVGLRVASHAHLKNVPVLAKMQKAGVKVSTDTNKGHNETVHGPLIVYTPTLESLCRAEDEPQATAIVVVGAYGLPRTGDYFSHMNLGPRFADGLLAWISAFRPEHLDGELIKPKDPILPDPVVWQAMKSFTDIINTSTGLADPRDRSRVTDGLIKLRKAGHSFAPNDLLAAALALNWPGRAAWELSMLADEINKDKRKLVTDRCLPDVVQIWEQQSQASED